MPKLYVPMSEELASLLIDLCGHNSTIPTAVATLAAQDSKNSYAQVRGTVCAILDQLAMAIAETGHKAGAIRLYEGSPSMRNVLSKNRSPETPEDPTTSMRPRSGTVIGGRWIEDVDEEEVTNP